MPHLAKNRPPLRDTQGRGKAANKSLDQFALMRLLAVLRLSVEFVETLVLIGGPQRAPVANDSEAPCGYGPGMPRIYPATRGFLLPGVDKEHSDHSHRKHGDVYEEKAFLLGGRKDTGRHGKVCS